MCDYSLTGIQTGWQSQEKRWWFTDFQPVPLASHLRAYPYRSGGLRSKLPPSACRLAPGYCCEIFQRSYANSAVSVQPKR